jgi:hypothetical protein
LKSAEGWAICVSNVIYRRVPIDTFGRLSAEHTELTAPLLVAIKIDRVDFIILPEGIMRVPGATASGFGGLLDTTMSLRLPLSLNKGSNGNRR